MSSHQHGAPALHAIGWELGKLEPIANILDLAADADRLETMSHLGLSCYARSGVGAFELALASCRQTLQRAQISPADIDGFVFATSSLDGSEDCRRGLRQLHGELRLERAHPIATFGSECGNGPAALRLALDMQRARRLRHVLLVTADCAGEGRRIMDGYVSIFSDGAASCLLSAEGEHGFAVEAVELHCEPAMWDVSVKSNLVAYLKGSMNGAAHCVAACRNSLGLEPRQIRKLITGNYNRSVLGTYARQLGFDGAQMFDDNLPRFAHSYAADAFINLHSLRHSGGLAEGEYAVLLGSGLNTWGAVVVRTLLSE